MGKKPVKAGAKDEEDRSGPIFIFVPNGKEQRIKEERALKVSSFCPREPHLSALLSSTIRLVCVWLPNPNSFLDSEVELHDSS